jgi:putative zinc finger/helix-turn-helix YgiT family protein
MINVSAACAACGGSLTTRSYEHVESVAGVKVKDATGFLPQCQKCGEVELDTRQLAGYQRRAAAVVLRDAKTLPGGAVKYARKALGLSQVDLATLLGIEPETLSRYETERLPIPSASRLAIVALLDGAEQGLDIKSLVERERAGRPSLTEMYVLPPTRRVS